MKSVSVCFMSLILWWTACSVAERLKEPLVILSAALVWSGKMSTYNKHRTHRLKVGFFWIAFVLRFFLLLLFLSILHVLLDVFHHHHIYFLFPAHLKFIRQTKGKSAENLSDTYLGVPLWAQPRNRVVQSESWERTNSLLCSWYSRTEHSWPLPTPQEISALTTSAIVSNFGFCQKNFWHFSSQYFTPFRATIMCFFPLWSMFRRWQFFPSPQWCLLFQHFQLLAIFVATLTPSYASAMLRDTRQNPRPSLSRLHCCGAKRCGFFFVFLRKRRGQQQTCRINPVWTFPPVVSALSSTTSWPGPHLSGFLKQGETKSAFSWGGLKISGASLSERTFRCYPPMKSCDFLGSEVPNKPQPNVCTLCCLSLKTLFGSGVFHNDEHLTPLGHPG